jgi:hypothetical protein
MPNEKLFAEGDASGSSKGQSLSDSKAAQQRNRFSVSKFKRKPLGGENILKGAEQVIEIAVV